MRALLSRLLALFRRGRLDARLEDEVNAHLDMLAAEHERRGMTPDEARHAARRAFGGVEPMKEHYRDRRGLPWLDDLVPDVRYAGRNMRRHPGFTAVAVLTLALGIGVNTALFSVADAVLFRPLPVHQPDELVIFVPVGAGGVRLSPSFSYPVYEDFRRAADGFAGITAYGGRGRVRLAVLGDPLAQTETATAQPVSGNFFSLLGVGAATGRTLTPADDRPEAAAVVVLSHGFWSRRFGRDANVVGRQITLNGVPFTIVGVGPSGFSGFEVGDEPDLWRPLQSNPALGEPASQLTERGNEWLRVIGRVMPEANLEQARAQMTVVLQADRVQRLEQRPGATMTAAERQRFLQRTLYLESGASGSTRLRGQLERPLLVLMAVVALVLLIACANVANLLLARSAARRAEIGVRMALGASRRRLVRQLATESALLAVLGGFVALSIAPLGSRLIPAFVAGREISVRAGLDARVLAFAAFVSLTVALVVGIAPALMATRIDAEWVSNAQRTTRVAGGLTVHNAIVVAQIALSLVVLIGGGLFVRTLHNLHQVDTGFDQRDLTLFSLDTPRGYDASRRAGVYHDVIERLAASPDVAAASFSFFGLLSNNNWSDSVGVADIPPDREALTARGIVVGPAFFETTGIQIVRGRALETVDDASSVRAAVVNQTMARQLFGEDPLGRRFVLPGWPDQPFEVIGVAADSTYRSVRDEAHESAATFYVPVGQAPASEVAARMTGVQVMLRSSSGISVVDAIVRRAVREVDPAVAIVDLRSMKEAVDRTIGRERLVATLATWLGVLTLALGAVGVYGVRAFAVSQRTSELGIRIALGATSRDVFRLVMRQGILLAVLGIGIGAPMAAGATRYADSLLFGVTPLDPTTFVAAGCLLATAVALASYLPARRASSIDPLVAVRTE